MAGTGRRPPGVVGTVGRVLVGLAVLLALFVAYQLWGTGLAQARSQGTLRREFAATVAAHRVAPTPEATGRATTGAAAAAPATGRPVGVLTIPSIGVDQVVVEGVGAAQLEVGPGHYPGTPLPGQRGNAAIAGHRTTFGRPFYDLNRLVAGDPVTVTTVQGAFHYVVVRSEVVAPDDGAVLAPTPTPELTLTTCTPRYSAAQRLVVVSRLVSLPAPGAPAAGAGPGPAAVVPDPALRVGDWLWVAVWAVLAVAVVLTVRLARRRLPAGRSRVATAVAVPVMAVVVFGLFGAVNALLPASF